jgi:cobaltochelatase CobS
VLYALITNQRAYLHGHTGTGKTTLVEQVGAFLFWPVMRVNFDSEITRMDLIGRDVLSSVDGATTSTFVDGILPQMMSGPYIGIFDEIDFVRPDVAYVMQRALEGNGLMLTEDGGRIVKPHKMFRMFATGNTVGQGDEFGMYQGARPQSMALLDRFTVWVKIDYMNEADRSALIKSVGKGLSASVIRQISQYVGEHLEAFTTAKVLQPISPRTFLAFTSAASMFTSMDVNEPVQQALQTTILDRASVQDRAVLNGLATRVFS